MLLWLLTVGVGLQMGDTIDCPIVNLTDLAPDEMLSHLGFGQLATRQFAT